jgi:hypothetical protein
VGCVQNPNSSSGQPCYTGGKLITVYNFLLDFEPQVLDLMLDQSAALQQENARAAVIGRRLEAPCEERVVELPDGDRIALIALPVGVWLVMYP